MQSSNGGGVPAAGAEAAIQTVIIDPDPAFRDLLHLWLDLEPDFRVVAGVAEPGRAVRLCRSLQPGLVVCDLELARDHRFAILAAVRAMAPDAVLVLMSTLPDAEATRIALDAGADAYVDKGLGGDRLVGALRAVVADRF